LESRARCRQRAAAAPPAEIIADDGGAFRRVLRTYVTLQNCEACGEAIDGTDVLKKAIELEPAVIILDLRMPSMNGVEVASVLKVRMPNVRLVLLTVYDEVSGYESLMSAIGIDAMIPKIDCFDSLAGCVRGLLSNSQRKTRLSYQTTRSRTGSEIR
jgi:DNA-binding NarL/FixJ family response regulator